MTAYAGTHVAYRPHVPSPREAAARGVRGSLRQWRAAFRSAGSPRREDADFTTLLMLGRD